MPWSHANFGVFLAALVFIACFEPACAQEPQVTPLQSSPNPVSPIPNVPTAGSPVAPIPNAPLNPIAIVPIEGVELTGTLDFSEGKAVIAKSGTVTAGKRTATVTLPHRGQLLLCATSKVNLTADSSIPVARNPGDSSGDAAGVRDASGLRDGPGLRDAPGLLIAIDHGALEAKFATGKNSDVVLTPDFRILISGPGIADVQVRLAAKGDTCVDNSGADAPYVAVSSVFDGGVYRVQAGQRVMFQHGSLTEVVDNERESCGCPPEPPTLPTGNEFPIAQSAGLTSVSPAVTTRPGEGAAWTSPQIQATLTHNADEVKPSTEPTPEPSIPSAKPDATVLANAAADATKPVPAPPKAGAMRRIGRFFKKLFGG